MGYIYKVTNLINSKIYIGKTIQKDINTRWKNHRNKYSGVKLLDEDYKQYEIDNFKFDIICICFDSSSSRYEKEYIIKYNTLHPNGYNSRLGGGGPDKTSEETKKKMSLIMTGKKPDKSYLTEEYRKKMSERMKGEKNSNFGKKMSQEQRQKISKSRIGKKINHTEETKKKISIKRKSQIMNNSVKVKQYTLDGEFIKEFPSMTSAAKEYNVSLTSIKYACNGKNKTCKGFIWKYS